tara:strand:+ start:278 stop:784 length:507 start_codon:yes stop_codon:yes gene_type:complete
MHEDISIRWMRRKDVSTVADIERNCFEDNWDEQSIIEMLNDKTTIIKVASLDNHIRGYNFYMPTKECFQILNIAVEPGYRRKSVGAFMVADMFKNSNHFKRNIDAWVCERKIDVLLFLKKHGFKPLMLVEDLFATGDGILMRFSGTEDIEIYDHYIEMIGDRDFKAFY